MIDEPDYQGISCLDYAKMTERAELIDMIERMKVGV